ncbi:helix-turn-helix domain-containing protein [Nesterenkonia massiliensis]|uniref:helix-turn-helix domain-containing protein n=1 Tax=Nesterenkonia massiliensis TaxID=1232429 RepID=UPI0021A2D5CE
MAKYSRGPQTGLSAANRKELAAGYAAGVPLEELAKRFGVHRATVNRIATQAGLQARRVTLSDHRQLEAARLYAEGMTLREVAKRLNTGKDAVRAAAVANGVTIRKGIAVEN